MNTALYDSIARIARHEAGARAVAGVGRVVDLFPAGGAQPDHAVSVEMRDSGLVLPRVPIAVGAMGFAAIPAIDDLVIVVFADGDYNAPVVIGRLYHPDQEPPEHADGEIVLRLPSGSSEPKLNLEIVGETPSLKLELPEDVSIEVGQEKVLIRVGEMHLSVESSGGGRAEVAAGGSKITLKQDGDVTIEAANKLTLKGTEIDISGSAKVSISGANVEVN
jgi:uncharacterized protein involved in type VI secretion and phage assembly